VTCMFNGCVLFNSDVSQWNVSRAVDKLQGMFYDCPLFDRELVSGWLLTAALRRRLFLYQIEMDEKNDDDIDNNDIGELDMLKMSS
jgi:Mycoplasma protein of unknown function, DUF285